MTEATIWVVLVTAGLVLSGLAVAAKFKVGSASAPFTGEYRAKVELGTVLAPVVAVAVLLALRAGAVRRLPWRLLLLASTVAAVVWSVALALVDGGNGLASPVSSPDEYLADVPFVHGDPAGFVGDFVDDVPGYSVATRTHPPAPVILLWALESLGIHRAVTLGLVLTTLGCLTVPCVAVATRSLCGEAAARRLIPVLVLAPYAVWVAVSMDAVTAALTAGFIACGVTASEPGRRIWWALSGGVLLGVAALFSYSVGWLAAVPLLVCYKRRRGRAISVMALGALVPLGLVRLLGFVWPDGLTAAQRDISLRVGPSRSWLLWAVLDLVLLLIACGPLLVTAARGLRRSPGWPLVVGGLIGVGFAIGSGLARGEVERSWLPFFPWLLVPAVAQPGERDDAELSPWLLGIGALTAIVIESVLRSAW